MRRNLLLGVILLIAAATAYFVWKTKGDTSTTLSRTASNFRIEDINSIGRIIITQKDGTKSDLKRSGDHWIINDSHRVRKTNIDVLLRGIQRFQLEHIPAKEASKNILASMAESGIHVQIFDHSDQKLLGYFIGGVTLDERGTYFLKEGTTQPYSLVEPGFDGGLRARFSLRPVDWRDVRFWVEDTDQIDTLKVHYPRQRQHSFLIFKKGNEYGIKPMFSTTPIKSNENSVKIRSYLTTLSGLACENFLKESPEKDSILQMVSFMEMEMVYPDEKSYLRFFPAGTSSAGGPSGIIPRYFIDYAGKDFMIGQHEVLKGAFRSYDYFFE